MIKFSKYYCKKCNRFHYRGEIYYRHLKFKEDKRIKKDTTENSQREAKKKKKIPTDKVINFNYETLRPIAKRQIDRLYKKMRKTNKEELYIFQINKVLIHEKKHNGKGIEV